MKFVGPLTSGIAGCHCSCKYECFFDKVHSKSIRRQWFQMKRFMPNFTQLQSQKNLLACKNEQLILENFIRKRCKDRKTNIFFSFGDAKKKRVKKEPLGIEITGSDDKSKKGWQEKPSSPNYISQIICRWHFDIRGLQITFFFSVCLSPYLSVCLSWSLPNVICVKRTDCWTACSFLNHSFLFKCIANKANLWNKAWDGVEYNKAVYTTAPVADGWAGA